MDPNGTVNWYFIFATLTIRFIGVFMILAVLWLGISVMSKIVAKILVIKNKNKS